MNYITYSYTLSDLSQKLSPLFLQ